MSKTSSFDAKGFRAHVAKSESAFNAEMRQAQKSIASRIRSGEIPYDQVNVATAKAFNTALVNLHKAYSAGQKTYGYVYTLEQR